MATSARPAATWLPALSRAWVLGLLTFAASPLSIHAQVGVVTISFDWSLCLALLAALAFGVRGALVAGLLGLASFTPFLLWPNNGWGNVGSWLAMLTLFVVHGLASDAQRRHPRWFTNPIMVQLPLSAGYAAMVYFAYPGLLAANPAPWCSDCITTMPDSVRAAIGVKSFVMYFVDLNIANSLLLTASVRMVLGLPRRPHSEGNGRVVLVALAFGALLWVVAVAMQGTYLHGALTIPWLNSPPHGFELISLLVIVTGTLIAAQAVIHFAERLRAEAAQVQRSLDQVATQEHKLRRLFDAVDDAMLLVDPNTGAVLQANRRARALFGEQSPQALRAALGSLTRAELDASAQRLAERACSIALSGNPARAWTAMDQAGKEFPALGSFHLTRLEPTIDVLVCTVRDVSAQRRVEEELAQSRKLDAVGRLAGGVAHDFNNMLSAILGGSELLELDVAGNAEATATLQVIRNAAERSRDLTQQLLSLARKGSGAAAPVDVHELLQGTAALLARTTPKHVQLELQLDAVERTVLANASQLQSAFLNLGINAAQAMPSGGVLRFTTETIVEFGSSMLRVRVEDTGHGIPEEHLDQIFEPFFTTKHPGAGTGLGLASVWGCVQQLGGKIGVTSELGKGTRFTLELPLTSDPIAQAAPPPSLSGRANGLVLLLDAEDLVRATAATMLGRLGYQTQEAEAWEAALSLLEQPLDAILLDEDLARSWQEAREERIARLARHAPLILCCGAEGATKVVDAGDDALPVLRKPFTAPALLTAIEGARCARQGASAAASSAAPATSG